MPKNLRRIREQRGLSLAELAGLAGIGKSTLGNYEQGKTAMSEAKIKTLAICLKTTPEDIDRFTDDSTISQVRVGRRVESCQICPSKDARITDLERQLERANETIASQARTIEAMQQGLITEQRGPPAVPTARAGGLRHHVLTSEERRAGA